MRFKTILKYILTVMVFAVIYIVMREQVSWLIVLSGLFLSTLALVITDRFLLRDHYYKQFTLKPIRFVLYFIYLLYKIFASGFYAAQLTLTGNAKHSFITFKSALTDDFKLNLLANSITLTPGTVTINREGNKLLVLQLIKQNQNPSLTDIEKFEQRLLKL